MRRAEQLCDGELDTWLDAGLCLWSVVTAAAVHGRQDVDKLTGDARFMTESTLRSHHTHTERDRQRERERERERETDTRS